MECPRLSPFQRIIRNLGAIFSGKLISIIQQIVIPPIFIYRYSLISYGEWIALSGAVSILGTLNFGVNTYMNQDLAVRFQRGETQGYHVRQSTALRLLLTVVLTAAVLFLLFFFIPFDTLLKLHISRSAAQWTLYLLAMQVLFMILFGYLSGIFMGVAMAHRGANWNNTQAFASSLGLLVGVLLHAPFPVLAAIQLSTLLLCSLAVLADLRRTAPEVFPGIRFWDGTVVKDILHGSGYFGLIEVSTFLTYSAPMLLLQRFVGPIAVAAFVLMRTIFSMCRQILAMFTQSMGPEITNLFGRSDWPALGRLYDYSERVIFFLITLVNLTVLMLSPVLITLWVHRKAMAGAPVHHVSDLFTIYPYVLSSAISIVISLKEHKFQFQFSTNTHIELAKIMFFSYIAMVAVSFGTIQYFGVVGFLWTWLAVETLQTARLVRLNEKLFAHVEKLDTIYITRLASICIVSLFLAFAALTKTSTLPLVAQAAIATLAALMVGTVAWYLFRVKEVYSTMLGRFSKRFA
jgi:O-antigen/teichoic acid export membrane protein